MPLQWLTEKNWFFRLSAYQERLERHFAEHPDFVQPDFRRNEMLGFIRGGLEDFSISRERTPGGWGIPFPIAENGETALREDGSWDPEAGVIYVWYDALINYITGAGFPDDPDAFERWWPADLHVIGKDIARFHTIFWPAMLWSAGLEAPRHVWVHGWLLAAGGERMSKSRGNFLDPNDFVAAFGADGARYVVLREVPFDRDAEVSWDSFVRRYNADLANDFGNLREPHGVDDQPLPRRGAAGAAAGRGVAPGRGLGGHAPGLRRAARGLPAARRPRRAVGVRRRGEQGRRCRAAMGAGQGGQGRRRGCGRRGCAACSATCSRRAGSSAWPSRRSCRRSRPRVLASSGYEYAVRRGRQRRPADPRRAGLGRQARGAGRVTAPEPLFPRLDVETDRAGRASSRRASLPCPDAPGRLATATSTPTASRPTPTRCSAPPGWPASSASSSRAGTWPRASARWTSSSASVAGRGRRRPSARRGQGRRRRLGADRRAGPADERVVAIGETGLDYDRVFSPIPDQLANLRRNLALALETGKPAILHCRSAAGQRDAQDALLAELRAAGRRRGAWAAAFGERPPVVIHSFSGPPDYARAMLDLGRRDQLLRPRLPGAARRHRPRSPRSSRRTGSWSRPIRRSSPRPAHRARATNPSGCASPRHGSRSAAGDRRDGARRRLVDDLRAHIPAARVGRVDRAGSGFGRLTLSTLTQRVLMHRADPLDEGRAPLGRRARDASERCDES